MSLSNIFKNSLKYSKTITSKTLYLDECSEIMNNQRQFLEILDEDDVLEIDRDINIFFDKNIDIQIVSILRVNYNIYKQTLRKHQELKKRECTERNRKKLEKELDYARWSLENYTENKEEILNSGHLNEIQLKSTVEKLKNRIENLEANLNDIENYCNNHGIEIDFGKMVIVKMNEFIKEKRKESF